MPESRGDRRSEAIVRDALTAITSRPEARLRLAFLSDCAAYEHWLKFELAYEVGRFAYFGEPGARIWTTTERNYVDVSIHEGDHPICDIELKVLTNNKNFADAIGGAKNSVARDFAKLRARPTLDGVVVVSISRRRYTRRGAWNHYRDLTMERMRDEVCGVAARNGAAEFFRGRVIERPVERMSEHLDEHELEVLAFIVRGHEN